MNALKIPYFDKSISDILRYLQKAPAFLVLLLIFGPLSVFVSSTIKKAPAFLVLLLIFGPLSVFVSSIMRS